MGIVFVLGIELTKFKFLDSIRIYLSGCCWACPVLQISCYKECSVFWYEGEC